MALFFNNLFKSALLGNEIWLIEHDSSCTAAGFAFA